MCIRDREETAELVDQIASALYAAHRHGIVHHNVKADNILLDEDHNAYLSDFRLAGERDPLTEPGSWDTLAPEQLVGEVPSAKSDQYSLAVVAYHLLTGRSPFPVNALPDDMRRHILAVPVSYTHLQ